MKHLITMTACLMVLMALLSQFVQNQKLLSQLESGSHAVDAFCKSGDEIELKSSLSGIMDCERSEVMVVKDKDTFIITVPVKSILATPSFWGIDPVENVGQYRWERKSDDG